jgi:hypothetical protein
MKFSNKCYIFLTIFFFSSCGSKKSIIEYRDIIVKDTIIQTKTQTLVERYTDTLTIEEPCDSLGNLKPFNQVVKVKQGNIKLSGINNAITAEIDLEGYKNTLEREFISKYNKDTNVSIKEVVRYKVPFWAFLLPVVTLVIGYFIRFFKLF